MADGDDFDITIIDEDLEEIKESDLIPRNHNPRFQVYGADTQKSPIQAESYHALNHAYADLKKRYNQKAENNKDLQKKLRDMNRNSSLMQSLDRRSGSLERDGPSFRPIDVPRPDAESIQAENIVLQDENKKLENEVRGLRAKCDQLETQYEQQVRTNHELLEKAKEATIQAGAKKRESQQLNLQFEIEKTSLQNEAQSYNEHLEKNRSRVKELEKLLIAEKESYKKALRELEVLTTQLTNSFQDAAAKSDGGPESISHSLKQVMLNAANAKKEVIQLRQMVMSQKNQMQMLVIRMEQKNARRLNSPPVLKSPRVKENIPALTGRGFDSSKKAPSGGDVYLNDVTTDASETDHTSVAEKSGLVERSISRSNRPSSSKRREIKEKHQGTYVATRDSRNSRHENKTRHLSGNDDDLSDFEFDDLQIHNEPIARRKHTEEMSAMKLTLRETSMSMNDSEHSLRNSRSSTGALQMDSNLDALNWKHPGSLNSVSDHTLTGRQNSWSSEQKDSVISRQQLRVNLNSKVTNVKQNMGDGMLEYEARGREPHASPTLGAHGVIGAHGVENRYRDVPSSQPRPLNIERNDHGNGPTAKSYNNVTQNVNLNSSSLGLKIDEGRSQEPVLNNNPLLGHKTIPRKNLFNEESDGAGNVELSQPVAVSDDSRVCPVCGRDFPVVTSMEDFQQHVLDCVGPDSGPYDNATSPNDAGSNNCPVCQLPIGGMTDGAKAAHVNNHFDEQPTGFEVVNP